MYLPTTDANRILEAIDTLRDLRSQAVGHYYTLNNWLIIDTLTDVITLLQAAAVADEEPDPEPDIDDEPPPDYGPPGSGAVIVEYD